MVCGGGGGGGGGGLCCEYGMTASETAKEGN